MINNKSIFVLSNKTKNVLKIISFIVVICLAVVCGNIVANYTAEGITKSRQISKQQIEEYFEKKLDSKYELIPVGSTNITDVGNGWITFEFDDAKFLFYADFCCMSDRRQQCITSYKSKTIAK